MKRLKNKIEKYIIKSLKGSELISLELKLLDFPHKEKLYDVKFQLKHSEILYTFETSNYYFYKSAFQWTEDVYENIDNLLYHFKFLQDNYDYFIGEENEDEDYEEPSIEDVAFIAGFEIDDDDHWVPTNFKSSCFDEHEFFEEFLNYEGDTYTFDYSEENGKFYWKG